jgi:cyclophilin family peptidyl-prolyl cis-trans isomerase
MKAMSRKLLLISLLLFLMNSCSMGQGEKETLVLIQSTMDDMTVKLYNDTPKHRDNFIKLINEGWYKDSPFHRIIKEFMIQGGGNADGRQDPGYTVEAEFRPNHLHKKGALAAARMPDHMNRDKRSSGCQFYIVQGKVWGKETLKLYEPQLGKKFTDEQLEVYSTIGGSPHLDGEYTVFGEVIMGFEVIDKIAGVKTGSGDKPVEPVSIKSMEILD